MKFLKGTQTSLGKIKVQNVTSQRGCSRSYSSCMTALCNPETNFLHKKKDILLFGIIEFESQTIIVD
jgi:hypothetical protein